MIVKWAPGFPAAFDSACIMSGISQLSFYASAESNTYLNNLGTTANLDTPVTVVVVVLDGAVVLVVAVALT